MKVLIAGGGTGGHLMPALALADALASLRSDLEPILVGAERGVEASILPERRYRFYLMPVEPIHRRAWWRNVRWLGTFGRVMRQCHNIIQRERPAFIVGTGGYAAGPILWAGHRRRIPIGVQEQNAYPGLTTRFMARRAAQVHLGFPEAQQHLRGGHHTRFFTLGNPIVPPPLDRPDKDSARRALGITSGGGVCLVMCGSQGSRSVNRMISAALDSGALDDVTVLWSTGFASWDEFGHHDAPPGRQVRPFWDPIAPAYAAADVVVARAGAVTIAELAAWGLPAILIPLPTAAADHQSTNAKALALAGAAVHLPERGLTDEVLAERIAGLINSRKRLETMAHKATERSHPNAARHIAEQLLTLAE